MEPVSIALAVVPICVSITQRVAEYWKHYKNQEQEVERLRAATERLHASLKTLDSTLQCFNSAEKRVFTLHAVAELDALKTGVTRLEERVKVSLEFDEPLHAREKLSNRWKKVWYPFDRSDLMSELEEVKKLQSTAIEASQL